MSALVNPNALLVRVVSSHHDLAGFSSSQFLMAPGPFGAGTLLHSHTADPDGLDDDRAAIDHAGTFCRSFAAQDDGGRYAVVHVVCSLECAFWFVTLLVSRKHSRVCAAVYYQQVDEYRS